MTDKQTYWILFLGVLFLALIIQQVRHHRFRERYAILWILVGVLFLSVPFLHDFYSQISMTMGIVNPISFFFFIAVLGLFLLGLQFTLAISCAFEQRRQSIQQLALLEERVRVLEQKLTDHSLPATTDPER